MRISIILTSMLLRYILELSPASFPDIIQRRSRIIYCRIEKEKIIQQHPFTLKTILLATL